MRNGCQWLLFVFCLAACPACCWAQSAPSNEINQTILQGRVALDAGNLLDAETILSQAWESLSNEQLGTQDSLDAQAQRLSLVRQYVTLARKYTGSNDHPKAAEAYWNAVQCLRLDRLNDSPDSVDSRAGLISLTAATALLKQGQNKRALLCIRPILELTVPVNEAQLTASTKTALKIALNAFSGSQYDLAKEAYDLVAANSSEPFRAIGRLGIAWATIYQGGSRREIAELLEQFVIDYPDHAEAPKAARQAVVQWLKSGDIKPGDINIERADQAFSLVAQSHSHHSEVWQASAQIATKIAAQLAIESDKNESAAFFFALLQTETVSWLIQHGSIESDRLEKPEQAALAIVAKAFSQSYHPTANSNSTASSMLGNYSIGTLGSPDELASSTSLVERLVELDDRGIWTKWVLTFLVQQNQLADADHVASIVLSNLSKNSRLETRTGLAAQLAVGRWLGATNRWAVLSLSTEAIHPADRPAAMTINNYPDLVAWHRLIAESHMQRGLQEIAFVWWQDLVDVRGDTEFATLFRCAETAASVANVIDATQRLQDARKASGGTGFQFALLDLLEADLAIRDLRFDQARKSLQSVVRNTDSKAELRGRAQWMIGETFFLQETYRKAIEAYSLVEGLGPSSDWIAAALVQAGKSYEELGRTREASICYVNLIQRFADSAHADMARRRLASLPSPAGFPGSRESSAQTMKR